MPDNSASRNESTANVLDKDEQLADIRRTLELFCASGTVAELRVLAGRAGNEWPATWAGYFTNLDLMAQEALRFSGRRWAST